ncbi:MAG: nucleotidyltransferase domain-containing protein [Nocardioidaceae bacterium]
MDRDIRKALKRLFGHAESGELATLCRRHGIDLVVVFGSVVQDGTAPADLDLAVRFGPGAQHDLLTLLDDLYRMIGIEAVDLMVLNDAGPVARERAMVQGRLVYQSRSGIFATEQIAAIMERLDTDEMRRVELELMSR